MDADQAPERSPGGRPTKRTEETARRLCDAIGRGLPFTYACSVVNVSYKFFSEWRREDELFREQIESAVAACVAKRMEKIERAADNGDWRASAWLLEHCQPEHFAKTRIQHEHTGVVTHEHTVSREMLDEIAAARKKHEDQRERSEVIVQPVGVHEGNSPAGLLSVG